MRWDSFVSPKNKKMVVVKFAKMCFMLQPCCTAQSRFHRAFMVDHAQPQKPCLGVPESLLQELSNDAPNLFQALSWQNLAFGKVRGVDHWVTRVLLRTKPEIIYELENLFQTSGNGTRWIRVEAHRPFISKRSLKKTNLVAHFSSCSCSCTWIRPWVSLTSELRS